MIGEHRSPKFEMVVQIRDGMGNPTGKTKILKTDNAHELEDFLHKNTTNKAAKKPKTKKNNKSNKKQNTPIILDEIEP